MAQAVKLEDSYNQIFKNESKYVHPDASGLFGDIDEKVVLPIHEAISKPDTIRLYSMGKRMVFPLSWIRVGSGFRPSLKSRLPF